MTEGDDVILVEVPVRSFVTGDSTAMQVVEETPSIAVVSVGTQGPPGRQGIAGPAGGATPVKVGSLPISGHSAVAYDGDGNLVVADCRLSLHCGRVLGVTEIAYSPGDMAVVRQSLSVEHAGWKWTLGPVFVGMDGALTQTLPDDAVFSQVVGVALSSTLINVDPQPPIFLV